MLGGEEVKVSNEKRMEDGLPSYLVWRPDFVAHPFQLVRELRGARGKHRRNTCLFCPHSLASDTGLQGLCEVLAML